MKSLRSAMLFALCVGAAPIAVWAADAQEKKHHGAEHAEEVQADQTHEGRGGIFTRVGDWFATVGRSDERKQEIRTQRHARRAERRAQNEKKAHMRSGSGASESRANREGHGERARSHDGKRGEHRREGHGEGHGESMKSHDGQRGEHRQEGHAERERGGHGDAKAHE